MRRLLTALLFVLAAFVGIGNAANDTTYNKWFSTEHGIVFGGPACANVLNTSTTDTIVQGEPIGASVASITVVTKYAVGNAYDTATVADSLWYGALDTLFGPRSSAMPNYPRYDTAENSLWKPRVIWRSPGAAAGDTKYVYIKGYTNSGDMVQTTFRKIGTGNVDTCLAVFYTKVCSIYVEGQKATDSFALYAEPMFGVKVGTGLATATDSTAYVGVAQSTILPRHRGLVQWSGPGQVLVNATTNDIRNGYWLTPSGTAGYADASASQPAGIAIGRVLKYSQASGLAMALLMPAGGGATSGDLSALEAEVDTARMEAATAQDTANAALSQVAGAVAEADTALRAAKQLWFQEFRPGAFVIPAANGPALVQGDSTNFSFDLLAFDKDADEWASILFSAPHMAVSDVQDTFEVSIYWLADTAATDSVKWDIGLHNKANGQTLDTTLTSGGFMIDVNTGLGKVNVVKGDFTMGSLGPDDICALKINRDANAAAGDNLAHDAALVLVRVAMYR